MKYIWEEKDVEFGDFVGSGKNEGSKSIIGWIGSGSNGIYLAQVNSDGMIMKIGKNKSEAAEHLTKYNYYKV